MKNTTRANLQQLVEHIEKVLLIMTKCRGMYQRLITDTHEVWKDYGSDPIRTMAMLEVTDLKNEDEELSRIRNLQSKTERTAGKIFVEGGTLRQMLEVGDYSHRLERKVDGRIGRAVKIIEGELEEWCIAIRQLAIRLNITEKLGVNLAYLKTEWIKEEMKKKELKTDDLKLILEYASGALKDAECEEAEQRPGVEDQEQLRRRGTKREEPQIKAVTGKQNEGDGAKPEPPTSEVFMPTTSQGAVLEALDGIALQTDGLAAAADILRRNLFNKGKQKGGDKEVLWIDNDPRFVSESKAIELANEKLTLSELSVLLKPCGQIRYMRKGTVLRIHVEDFLTHLKTSDVEPTSEVMKDELPRSWSIAYAFYEYALDKDDRLIGATDHKVYEWLRGNLDDVAKNELVPNADTFIRYLREVRKIKGTQKNTPRQGRPMSRSMRTAKDI